VRLKRRVTLFEDARGAAVYDTATKMANIQQLYSQALDLYGKNQLEEAAELLRKTLAIDPDYVDAMEALGVILGKLERFDEAIEIMKRLADKTPDAIMPHTNLSIFYMRKGMIEEAENEKAVATTLSFGKPAPENPLDQEARVLLARAEAERKVETFRKMIALDESDFLMHYSLAKALVDIGQFEEAEKEFRRTLELHPDYSVAYQGLGKLLETSGKKIEAMRTYEKGIETADRLGDIMPKKAMEQRLNRLKSI